MTVRRRPIRQDGKRLSARPAQSPPHPDPVVVLVVRLLTTLAMADDGILRRTADTAAEASAGKAAHRIDLVFGLWQCDKKNHGWREGLPLTVSAKFRSEDRPSPSR